MKTKLKLIATSPSWQSHEGETWETTISLDKRYSAGNVHSFIYDNKEYVFDIKDLRVPKNKILLSGWLDGNGTAGKVIFELQ